MRPSQRPFSRLRTMLFPDGLRFAIVDDGDADRPIEVRAKAGTTGMEKRETKGCYALACVFVELGELDGGQPNGAGRGGAPGCGVV